MQVLPTHAEQLGLELVVRQHRAELAVTSIYLLYPEGLCTVVSISLYSCHDRDVRVCLAGLRCRLAEMRARALQTVRDHSMQQHRCGLSACATDAESRKLWHVMRRSSLDTNWCCIGTAAS
jgi:hypothetical protein